MIKICGSCDNNCGSCRTRLLLSKEKKPKKKLSDRQKTVRQCRHELHQILLSVWDNNSDNDSLSLKAIGCTIEELKNHLLLTAPYDGFDIHDYDHSKYHIDHIKPFQQYVDGNAMLNEITVYTNLRIISKKDNFLKSDKY